MGHKFSNIEEFKRKEFNFFIDGVEYECEANYEISTIGEYPSWDYPGDSESEVINLSVILAIVWDEDKEDWVSTEITKQIEEIVMEEIVKYHRL